MSTFWGVEGRTTTLLTRLLPTTRRCSGIQTLSIARFSISQDLSKKAAKLAFATIAATVLVAGAADARPPPPRFGSSDEEIKQYMSDPNLLTYDEGQLRAYLDAKGKGTGSKCPSVNLSSTQEGFKFVSGNYLVSNMCLEPTSYRVIRKASLGDYNISTTYNTRLNTRVDGIQGSLAVDPQGGVSFDQKKIDEAAGATVEKIIARLPGKEELVPFMFGIEELVATGNPVEGFGGRFSVPVTSIPPEGEAELTDETSTTNGDIVFRVTWSNLETNELGGEFETRQVSGLDLRSKSDLGFKIGSDQKKDVNVEGVWYAKLD